MDTLTQTLSRIKAERVVAILRGDYVDTIRAVADVFVQTGIRVLEITLNSKSAVDLIQLLDREYGDRLLVGAGTVLEVDQVSQAVKAGAKFIVSPDTSLDVVKAALDHGVLPIPGALTPTEVLRAHRAGANLIKLFPASLGGPEYLKTIAAPLDMVEFMATGGIDLNNAATYLKAGAAAIGVGSVLLPSRFDGSAAAVADLTERARKLREAVPISS